MDDGHLVGLVVAGNREAFGQLVARYQSPVCALAYSACGNVSQSEDLAQETFLIAWRKLGDLKEPAKFRSWLFGIARNLINNTFRTQTRNPLAAAESLDETLSIEAPTLNPTDQAIGREEEMILWKSLERIPEVYREPLVLFYREHQSIEQVAAVLELSEEAVRQRLSRGRKLLHEQVISFVEGALKLTAPGPAFTLAVLAALPGMTFSAKAATFGAVAKGGAAVKSAGVLGATASFLMPMLPFVGMWTDYRLKRKAGHPKEELKLLKTYYLGVFLSVIVFVGLVSLLMAQTDSLLKTHTTLFVCLSIAIIFGYPIALGLFAWRLFRTARKYYSPNTTGETAAARAIQRGNIAADGNCSGCPWCISGLADGSASRAIRLHVSRNRSPPGSPPPMVLPLGSSALMAAWLWRPSVLEPVPSGCCRMAQWRLAGWRSADSPSAFWPEAQGPLAGRLVAMP